MIDWSRNPRVQFAARQMKLGGVIAYPTEAVWGLGCDPWHEAAVTRIWDIKRRDPGKGLILMTNGPKITAYGIDSRFGWVHKALDLPPAVEDVEAATHGEPVSFEFNAKANPDWLLVLDRAAAIGANDQNAKATLDNALVAETTAWKSGQVIYLPSADFYIAAGGLKATERVLATIEASFSASQ